MNNLIKNLIVLLLIVFVACSKNEEGDVYSSLGTEVDKARLEAAGHSLFTNIGELSDTKFAKLSAGLMDMMADNSNSSNKRVVHSIAELGMSMANEESICDHFEAIEGISRNGEESLSSLWQDGKGTWEWDSEINDFIRVSETDEEIIYKLPSSKESISNDLILRIYDFEVYDGDFPGKGEELEDGTIVTEMISSLFFEMKLQDELVATSNINVDISNSGDIENVVMTFNPLPFSFQMEAVNANDHSKWRYSFLNDSEVVFEHLLYAEIAGTSEYMMIRKGQSSIQIKDIKMVASVEGNGFVTELALIEKLGLTGEIWAKSMADAVNKHVDMKVRYVSDNAIIAKAIAFPSNTNMDDNDWFVNFLLQFNDGSEISAEDFFEDDLSKFEIEFEDFLCDVEDRLK
ncbi:hypothetical protein [Carboxylicivirga sp. N1Y90]|uniref:hypothetical protein n=1 Tax=Carboxylicivirga fragile TaxID=3417571 RepID=UPI003D332A09|nr:hypothetical protein [Marinilabiliaceae bacterium N1Y90]